MQPTSTSLLLRARHGADPLAWDRLVGMYRPMIVHWLLRHDVSRSDAEDLAQDVLAIVVRELPAFEHSGRPGAFRTWIRTIAANRMRSFWRSGRCRPVSAGDEGFLGMVEAIEDERSDLSRLWNQEHDAHVVARILESIESEFQPNTMAAFRRATFDSEPAEMIARELGISVSAVYIAKSRVLRRLRQEAEGLLD